MRVLIINLELAEVLMRVDHWNFFSKSTLLWFANPMLGFDSIAVKQTFQLARC
jgi:hypothetical protein